LFEKDLGINPNPPCPFGGKAREPSRKAKYYCTPIANKYREGKFKSFAKQSEIDLKSGTNKHKESKRDNLVPSV